MTTVTHIAPAASRLEADLARAEEVLALARTAADLAPGATAFSRVAVYCTSQAQVDAIAAAWGVKARWAAHGRVYLAKTGDGHGEAEAAWSPSRAAERGAAA
jgi:hypothetical protein